MRWVIVAGDFRLEGGMDRANHALADFLARRGDEVHLVAHHVESELSRRPGVTVHAVARPLRSHLLGSFLIDRAGRRIARAVTRSDPSARVLVNGGNCLWPDLNWVHMVHAGCPVRDTGAPVSARFKNRVTRRRDMRAERDALAVAKVVIANSQKTRRELVGHLGVDPARVRVVYLGTDPELFGPITASQRRAARDALGVTNERPLLIFVGALGYERRKGLDTLLAAVHRLYAQREIDCEVLAVGSGALAFWQRHVDDLRLRGRIRLLGARSHVADLLAAADLFVAPTRCEPYGLAVHEALCRGLPAIVSESAGVAERYPAELRDLLLPDPEDVEDLASRIVRVLARRPRLEPALMALAANLRQRSWNDVAADIVAITESPIEVPRGP